jgi:L-asparaginase
VSIVKDGGFMAETFGDDPEVEADLIALVAHKLSLQRLAGFVLEGLVPLWRNDVRAAAADHDHSAVLGPAFGPGRTRESGRLRRLASALHIAGSNLTATKARMLLMACLLKFGSLPIAVDPAHPTTAEVATTQAALKAYQAIFDTH